MSMMKSVGPPPHWMLMPLLAPIRDVKLLATTTPEPALTLDVAGGLAPSAKMIRNTPGFVPLMTVMFPSTDEAPAGTPELPPPAFGPVTSMLTVLPFVIWVFGPVAGC